MIYFIYPAIQYGICLLSIILIIWYKLSFERSEKRRLKIETRLKLLFTQLLTGQTEYHLVNWNKEPLGLLPLLNVLEDFSDKFKDENWDEIRNNLSKDHLLPWARKHLKSRRWITKNTVIRIFLLNPLPEDLPAMRTLLHDKTYSIRMLACEAIGNLKIPEAIPLLISQMAREVPSARFIYRTSLLRAPHEHFPIFLKLFEHTKSDRVKISCLDIMMHQYYANLHPFLKKYLNSKNATIRMMIAKIFHLIQSDAARHDLTVFLNDPASKVRAAAVEALGDLRDIKSFEKVSQMLHDANYNVRLAAAFALIKYGKIGIRELELQDADISPKAHEVARFVLTLP